MVMYYLVKFEDGIYYICSKSRINKTTTSISVRYTGGAWYSATIIASNNDKSALVTLKTELEKEEHIIIHFDVETETRNQDTKNDLETEELLQPYAAIVENSIYTLYQLLPKRTSKKTNFLTNVKLLNIIQSVLRQKLDHSF
ncbi:uncharacterized protein [Leptinotarsa decemlineata]|uniref:uncharacterized protein n=1 Tax=Leptinotarsa decemlineata TaxID=7539 RepID=UPI003D3072B3